MATISETLIIMGAAEGSWFTVGTQTTDKRYVASFANANSGLSFGVFQFDCATNTEGRLIIRAVIDTVGPDLTPPLTRAQAEAIHTGATRRNAGASFRDTRSPTSNLMLVNRMLGSLKARTLIDRYDRERAVSEQAHAAALIGRAARSWTETKDTLFDTATTGYLRLEAYLMANLNRYPDNADTFEKWLKGEVTVTKNAPVGGWDLEAPPTVEQMHDFFKSLKMWDGTQGNYAYLRGRVDPALTRIIAARAAAAR